MATDDNTRISRVQDVIYATNYKEAFSALSDLDTIVKNENVSFATGCFAYCLASVNIVKGSQESERVFSSAGQDAKRKYLSQTNQPLILSSTFVFDPKVVDLVKGAEITEKILNKLREIVTTTNLDRWSSCWILAYKTIDLRHKSPPKEGGASLFDGIANMAWEYYEKNT